MMDTVIALVPDYGLALIFGVVFLACIAVPLPASVLVLTSGSFAAAGELSLVALSALTFGAFVLGDQAAFLIARSIGPSLLERFRASRRIGPVLASSEAMLQKNGAMAVFLSHTIVSPTCAYISYLSGAGGLSWGRFTAAALPGALVWAFVYVALGYVFAGQLELVAETLSNFFGLVLAVAVALGCFVLLRSRWRAARTVVSKT